MSIHWGRILLAAFLLELVLLAIAIPLNMRGERQVALYAIPAAALIVTYAFTVWLGKGIASKLVLHGALIGVAGTLMYVALTRARPEPWHVLANALKIAGGAAGGWVLAHRRPTTTS